LGEFSILKRFMNYRFKTYFYLLTVGLLLLNTQLAGAQDSTYVDVFDLIESNNIRWVNQIPALKEDKKPSKKGWLKHLILGKKELTSLQKPVAIIGLDPSNCIILDQGNGTLFMADNKAPEIPKFLRKKNTHFPSLVGACILPDDRVLFTDSKLNKIFVLGENKKQFKILNDSLHLSQPTGITYAKNTNQIWVVETNAHRISILDAHGQRVKTIGQRGIGPGEFNYPTYICIGPKGKVYVVDALNYRIQIFDAEGNFLSMFGENGNGTGYFASPKGIAIDSFGHIYVVDALFHGIQIFDTEGNYLDQFGKQGRLTEEFWMPSGIFIDATDHIYIADSYNSRIQIFELKYSK